MADDVDRDVVRKAAIKLFQEIDANQNGMLDKDELIESLCKKGFSAKYASSVLVEEAVHCGIEVGQLRA